MKQITYDKELSSTSYAFFLRERVSYWKDSKDRFNILLKCYLVKENMSSIDISFK